VKNKIIKSYCESTSGGQSDVKSLRIKRLLRRSAPRNDKKTSINLANATIV